MKLRKIDYLPTDLAQVKNAREFKRFNFFGLRFGPTRVRELRLAVNDGDATLSAQVRLGKTWVSLPAKMVDAMAERRFAFDTDRAIIASLEAPMAARPDAPHFAARTNGGVQVGRSASAPDLSGPGLQRRNALRRSVSAPADDGAVADDHASFKAPLASAQRPVLQRAPSYPASLAAKIETYDDASSVHSGTSSPGLSYGTTVSTPPTSAPTTPLALSTEPHFAAAATAYCDRLALAGTYGTEVELAAMAELLRRPIQVLTAHKNTAGDPAGPYRYTQWQTFRPAMAPAVDATPIKLLLDGGGTGSVEQTNGNHFVPLVTQAYDRSMSADEVAMARGRAAPGGWCLFDAVGQQAGLSKEAVRASTVAYLRTNMDVLHLVHIGDSGLSLADAMLK